MKIKRLILLYGMAMALTSLGCKEKSNKSESKNETGNEYPVLNKKTHSTRTDIFSPENELAGFKVPEGFVVELVASERDGVVNPIHMAFDDAGRLWTQTAEMYPLDPVTDIAWKDLLKLMDNPAAQEKEPNFKRILDLYRGKTKGKDKILVLSDLYGKSKGNTNIWADGLAIPQSILPYKGGAYVAQGSEMFFLEDINSDGKADKRTPLFTGFGFTDTHTMAHVLVRGPGDWIHFSQGALNKGEVSSKISDAKIRLDYSKIARFSLDSKKIELVSSGLNNIWGFKLRGNGQWYGMEANDLGYSVVPMEIGTGFPGIGSDRLRPYQPWMPELHKFRVGGTGMSGFAFADDLEGTFPKEWKDVAFIANPITSEINAVKIIRNDDGSVSAELLPAFLTSEDDWFRPVNMEFGPDGCLYIADWYNKIVSHNEVATTHPDRDKSHGRIWRIRHESQKPRDIPNFYEVKTSKLVDYLKSPTIWAKRAAWHQISDRPIEETRKLAKDLILLASDTEQDEVTRIAALWSLEGIKHYEHELIVNLLDTKSDNLRREVVRSLQSFSLSADVLANLLAAPAKDDNPMVRSQVLRTLDAVKTANAGTISLLVAACKPPLDGNAMGGPYERNFERYLARKALENYPNELLSFLKSSRANLYNTSNLIWAGQALPKDEREVMFMDLWKKMDNIDLDEPTFIIVAGMLGNSKIMDMMQPVLESEYKAQKHVSLTLENLAKVQSKELTRLLIKPIEYLLQGKSVSQRNLGLKAIGKLNISSLRSSVIPFIDKASSSETIKLAMLALVEQPEENKVFFERIAKMESLELDLRASAIEALAKTDMPSANKTISDWIPSLSDSQKQSITKILSNSAEGSTLLKQLFEKGILSSNEFDLSSAEKVFKSSEEDIRGIEIFDQVKSRMEEEKRTFQSKLQRFMNIAEKGGGDSASGEKLFQTCLMCHSVGEEGQAFAPALDGSALRENEALLTAILDPDAAMEGSYAVYRVTKKDGGNMEGYLVKRDNRGTTLGFMGGGSQFVQVSDIDSEGFLGGRSFMPKGLIDNYSEEQVSDLLAYIRTLE